MSKNYDPHHYLVPFSEETDKAHYSLVRSTILILSLISSHSWKLTQIVNNPMSKTQE